MQLDEFLRGLVEAALWTDLQWDDDDRESGNGHGTYDVSDVDAASLAKLTAMATEFLAANEADLDLYAELRSFDPNEGTIWDYCGHDAWLSAVGSGTGFWDRGLGDVGDRLHAAAKATFGGFEGAALPWEVKGETDDDSTVSFIA